MRALDRKLLRDVWGNRGPAAAIALVLACGVATFVLSTATLNSLRQTQARFYREARFADAFVTLTRAPEREAEVLRAIPGVTAVETGVAGAGRLQVPGFDETATALVVSIPDQGPGRLNALTLLTGRLPEAGRAREVVISDAFAEAHGLGLGEHLDATIRGQGLALDVVGIGLSPEFVMAIPPGGGMPDAERYAIVWMRRAPLAAALDLGGAFNRAALDLGPGASEPDVLDAIDRALAGTGAADAVGRSDQPSHYFLSEEFRQLELMATVLPAIFLGVVAFLLAVVVGRLVETERDEIATLKAFGYSTAAVAEHYIRWVLIIVAVGVVLGVGLGAWLGRGLSAIYAESYRFPYLDYRVAPGIVAVAALGSAAVAVAAALRSVWGAARQPPAQAMRPPAPAVYRRSLVERAGLGRVLGRPEMMILRHLERHPVRSGLSAAGIAMACAIVLLGRFTGDAVDTVLRVEFEIAQRQDVDLSFTRETAAAVRYDLAALPGVGRVELSRTVGVDFVRGRRRFSGAIIGREAGDDLVRVLDERRRAVAVPPEGLLLSAYIAGDLGVAVGDTLRVEVRQGDRRTREVPVVGLIEEFVGAGGYMERRALNRMLGEGDVVSGAALTTDDVAALGAALDARPGVAQWRSVGSVRRSIQESVAENLTTFTLILSAFAAAVAFGVLYNTARLSLAERDRDLASLRVLGFRTSEVAYLFFGELAVLTLVALPVGLVVGRAFCFWYVDALQNDVFRIPLVLTRASYTVAAALIVGVAVASALVVGRKLARLDLIAVLKTRE